MPQQINLDLIEAVSFEKGCYPGQEIVADALSRKPKAIFLLVSLNSHLEEPTFIEEGPIRIYSKNFSDENEIGSLITFTNHAFRPREFTFYGLGEFDRPHGLARR